MKNRIDPSKPKTPMKFSNKFSKIIESLWMPKEIKDASSFLQSKEENTIYNPNYIKEDCIILTFYTSNESEELMMFENSTTLNENISDLTRVINK